MKTAIVIHGMPSKEGYLAQGSRATNQHWFPWIKGELEKNGFEVFMPEMPEPYEPDYKKWSEEFEKLPLQHDTVLVGHSAGGGFLVRWLSENKSKVGKVVLVAPWIDPNHQWAPKMFNGLVIDPTLPERTESTNIFISMDDEQEELDTFEILKEKLPGLQVKKFTDKGHFILRDMHTIEFPELLEVLIK
jgi:predicted alpha/beta hydrolase family esterase